MRAASVRWLALLLALAPRSAEAAYFGMTVSGTIEFVDAQIDDGTFTVGAPVLVFIRVDASVADGEPGPTEGSYDGAATEVFVTFGDYEASGAAGEVFIRNGSSPNADEFYVSADMSGAPVAGLPLRRIIVDLLDTSFTAFSDDSIPTSLDLADFALVSASLSFDDGNFNYGVDVDIASLAYVPVPEPGAALLTAAGAMTLGSLRGGRGSRARPAA